MTALYKVLGEGGEAIHGGNGSWSLPRGSRPGKWMPTVPVDPCRSGYHVCRVDQLVEWLPAAGRVWVVEVAGEVVDAGDKVVAERARLISSTVIDTRVAQLLASDFAAHVHHHFDRQRHGDGRVAEAIRVQRMWANGRAGDAAMAAARDAAWDAAWDAAADAAADAAGVAAGVAAWGAAWDAAAAAAGDAERAWQTRLVRDVIAGRREAGRVRITRYKHEEVQP